MPNTERRRNASKKDSHELNSSEGGRENKNIFKKIDGIEKLGICFCRFCRPDEVCCVKRGGKGGGVRLVESRGGSYG